MNINFPVLIARLRQYLPSAYSVMVLGETASKEGKDVGESW